MNRIKRNQIVAERSGNVKANTIRHNVKNMKEGRVEGGARIRPSKVKERVVPVNRVNRPVSQGKFEEGKLKTKPRSRMEDQGQGSRKVQKVQRRKSPRVVKRQEVQRGDQRQARSKVQQGGQRKIPPRPEQRVREGHKRRETTQDRQLQQWQQGRQKNRSNRGREGNIGRGFSRPDSPALGGTVRSRSRVGPGKGWIRGKAPKVF